MEPTVEPGTGGSRAPLRVVIAGDDHFYREGLARMLEGSGMEVVRSVPSANAAIRAVEESAPDVVVMDLKMPDLSGIEATRRLSEQTPTSSVLVLSASPAEDDVADAILAGASAYLLKGEPMEEIIAGIRAAATGQSLVSQRIAAGCFGEPETWRVPG